MYYNPKFYKLSKINKNYIDNMRIDLKFNKILGIKLRLFSLIFFSYEIHHIMHRFFF